MKIIRQHEYQGTKIFIVQHRGLFQYWFSRDNEMYMQWGLHNPKWYRWIMALVGYPLIDERELIATVEAYQDNAVRSIDHLIDPEATHCPHNVVITGKHASKCAICDNEI